jgi:hypothetical protein
MSEREKLPKLKEKKHKINKASGRNGIIEELLKEHKMEITDINNLIYTAVTIITLTMNQHSERSKNRRM